MTRQKHQKENTKEEKKKFDLTMLLLRKKATFEVFSLLLCSVLYRPDHHFLEAICCFPMVYYMAGTMDK